MEASCCSPCLSSGTGKSYGAVPLATLTPQRYVSDAHELVQLLRTRFHQDKIYVLGSFWGSILGIWLVQQYPDLFYAYVGEGQMVNTTENDVMGYQFALTYAAQHGDTATVDTLRRNGPPPYVRDGMAFKYLALSSVQDAYMAQHESAATGNPFLAPEYGLIDKVNYFRGLYDVFTVLYPQLAHLDLTQSAARVDVPVYFLEGHWDVNAMPSLVERYYSVLQAPHKELIWFDKSGHGLLAHEPNKLAEVLVTRVLAQTWPRR